MVGKTDHFVVYEVCGAHVADSEDNSFVKCDAVKLIVTKIQEEWSASVFIPEIHL